MFDLDYHIKVLGSSTSTRFSTNRMSFKNGPIQLRPYANICDEVSAFQKSNHFCSGRVIDRSESALRSVVSLANTLSRI